MTGATGREIRRSVGRHGPIDAPAFHYGPLPGRDKRRTSTDVVQLAKSRFERSRLRRRTLRVRAQIFLSQNNGSSIGPVMIKDALSKARLIQIEELLLTQPVRLLSP